VTEKRPDQGKEDQGNEDQEGDQARGVAGGRFEAIDLSIPAQPVHLQLVRMTAGVVAARAELDLNHVEDLRLAVDELCLPFMDQQSHDARLYLRYEWNEQYVEISCQLARGDEEAGGAVRLAGPGAPWQPIRGVAGHLREELSSQILDALVDEHGEMTVEGHPGVWLRMRVDRVEGTRSSA
jgi:hypothetical protein